MNSNTNTKIPDSCARIGAPKVVDINAAPVSERPGAVVLMFQERTMAEKIDRQQAAPLQIEQHRQ